MRNVAMSPSFAMGEPAMKNKYLKPISANVLLLGMFHTVIGLVELPASVIAGFLWQYIAPRAAFIYGSVVSVIPVVLFIAFRTRFGLSKELNK